ncbi:MAG: 4Fe-4S dicluster domain-containing protein [Chloroflexota bacterium]|nr:4Fe-4S dicluster domain-containing protein [Chloroflexota bacterium]
MTIAVSEAAGTDLSFRDVVRKLSGEDIHSCFYCQKCTAGCPTAYVMDYKPARLLRLIQLGYKGEVLGSSAIWMCVSCETCGTRCPNHIRLAPVMDTLRQMALEEGYAPEPAIYALHQSFLDSIKLWGRVHELSMIMEYKTRCLLTKPPLFFRGLPSDMLMGADLVLKGKMAFVPERVKQLGEVKKLYEEASSASSSGHSEHPEVGQ